MINPIAALSPLDGRYAKSVEALRPVFSEYGLMRARVRVELSWLKALAAEPKIVEVPPFDEAVLAEIDDVIAGFSLDDAAAVKAIEATTNHDVKAIEYWLKERFAGVPAVSAVSAAAASGSGRRESSDRTARPRVLMTSGTPWLISGSMW